MIKHTLLTVFRNLIRNKLFFSLNTLGLAIGMAAFLLIAQYVKFETSYENFFPDKENIYRVTLDSWINNELLKSTAENYPGVGPALERELPDVVAAARVYNMGYKNNVVISYKDAQPEPVAFSQRRFLYADSSFLPMMGYPMVKGNAQTALAEPLSAVISEKYAALYFKEEDPIGKVLVMQDDDFNHEQAVVTGVFKDLPDNTHLKFDVLFSYKTLFGRGVKAWQRYGVGWERNDMYTFVKLRPGTDSKIVEGKLPAIIDKYKPELKEVNQKEVLALQPLKDIHLKSNLADEASINGDSRIVMFMSIIGIFLLIIAWINYVNLSTARVVERAKEVGVRKVIGAFKYQLINQFLIEAALINLFAVFLAITLVMLAIPFFNELSGLSLSISSISAIWFLLILFLLWFSGTFLSGIYPALVLSSYKPLTVLKGKLKSSRSGIVLRKGLVITQFLASIVLITSTIIINDQLRFMMNRDLGMDINQVLVLERPGLAGENFEAFKSSQNLLKNELEKIPSVLSASTSLRVPGKQREAKTMIKLEGLADEDSIVVQFNTMDYNFLELYKMELLAGRNFSPDHPHDEEKSVLVTESAAQSLGFKSASDIIGQPIVLPWFNHAKVVVIGVVNDYHQVSLKQSRMPGMFVYEPYGELTSVRIRTQNIDQAVKEIRTAWIKAFPGAPLEYFFLDDYFNQQYTNEQKFGKLFSTFAVLAIIIGCLGLFGLSAYTANQRLKEIGVRKVLGASVENIVVLLSKDIIKPIGIAFLIALPLSWWSMNKWLEDFAYRIDIQWWMFALAGLVAMIIGLLTVSFQAIKAAIINPVRSLRSE